MATIPIVSAGMQEHKKAGSVLKRKNKSSKKEDAAVALPMMQAAAPAQEDATEKAFREALDKILESSNQFFREEYDYSAGKLEDTAEQALREAYIRKMQEELTLPQQMAQMGLSGGATESVLAGIGQNYQTGRNGIYRNWMEELGDLGSDYQKNLQESQSEYQAKLADFYKMFAQIDKQLEADKILEMYKAMYA